MKPFYFQGQVSVQVIQAIGRKPNAIGQTLYWARLAAVQCFKHLAAQESTSEAPDHTTDFKVPNQHEHS